MSNFVPLHSLHLRGERSKDRRPWGCSSPRHFKDVGLASQVLGYGWSRVALIWCRGSALCRTTDRHPQLASHWFSHHSRVLCPAKDYHFSHQEPNSHRVNSNLSLMHNMDNFFFPSFSISFFLSFLVGSSTNKVCSFFWSFSLYFTSKNCKFVVLNLD